METTRRPRVDYTKTPVQIIHPAKVQGGRAKCTYFHIFKYWRREIVKPDFAIQHASKAVRLLVKLDFKGMPDDWPELARLLNRTRTFLERGEGTPKDIAGMLWTAARLQEDVPEIQEALLPALAPMVPPMLPKMSAEELRNVFRAARELRQHAGAGLWARLPEHVDSFAGQAGSLNALEVHELAPALGDLLADGGHDGRGVPSELLAHVHAHFDEFWYKLPRLAEVLWHLLPHAPDRAALWREMSPGLVKQCRYWNSHDVDPHLWRLAMVHAKLGLGDTAFMKAVARRAMKEELATLSTWGIAALSWAFAESRSPKPDVLGAFRRLLGQEAARRSLDAALLDQSLLGPDGGGDRELRAVWEHYLPQAKEKEILVAPAPVKLLNAAAKRKATPALPRFSAAERKSTPALPRVPAVPS